MGQKKDRSFRRYAIFGAIWVAAVLGVLLAPTYAQSHRQDILQDKPQGIICS